MEAFQIEPLLRGDEDAWQSFVDGYTGLLRTVVREVLGRRCAAREVRAEDVADVVQQVFERLCRNDYRLLRAYDPKRSRLSTWLLAIARNTAIDATRRRVLRTVPLDEAPADSLPRTLPPEPQGFEVPPGVLTGRQRLVLHLLFDRESSVKEVASALGVREQTVRSTRHKALERLRRHFAADPKDPVVVFPGPGMNRALDT